MKLATIKIKLLTVAIVLSCFLLSSQVSAQEKQKVAPKNLSANSEEIQKIEKYLNEITTLIAPFEQEDSAGGKATGTFYLARPGRLRWDYQPPTPILIVAKGSLVAYYDKELNEVSHISLDDTLAGFLTRQKISFGDDGVKILDFEKKSGETSITISQEKKEEQGNLTMFFNSTTMDLVRMEVIDSIGKTTIVRFHTPVYGKPLDKELFALPRVKKERKD